MGQHFIQLWKQRYGWSVRSRRWVGRRWLFRVSKSGWRKMEVINQAIGTDAGMFALWNAKTFKHITDYDLWEIELCEDEDIQKHILAGALVPINIGADGGFQFVVRVGNQNASATLNNREALYLAVSSEPYLLLTSGNAYISGIEGIRGDNLEEIPHIFLSQGRYTVTIHMLDWGAEDGARDASGNPTATALSDFVVLINPEIEKVQYRQKIVTFDHIKPIL